MTQCIATTRDGARCRNLAQSGKFTCHVHKLFVLERHTQKKIVGFANYAAHTFLTLSDMRRKFCVARVDLPPNVSRKMDEKERRMDKIVRKMQRLAESPPGTAAEMDLKVDKYREMFRNDRSRLFSLITEHCKRSLDPPYVVPAYPPTQELVTQVLRREDPTEMRYVRLMVSFTSIFLRWSAYGLIKSFAVIAFLYNNYWITMGMVAYFLIKYPKQVGRMIPGVRNLIFMWDAMIEMQEATQRQYRELKSYLDSYISPVMQLLKNILNIQNPLRVLADRVHAYRQEKTAAKRIEAAQLEMAASFGERHIKYPNALPMPDHVLLFLKQDNPSLDWLHGNDRDAALSFYQGISTTPRQGEYAVLALVGLVLTFFKRVFR